MISSKNDIVSDFKRATQEEPLVGKLAEVYRTGIMFSHDGEEIRLNDTSLGLTEGQILWSLARQLKPKVVIETGFGRGGSAAFLLAGTSPWNGRVISIDPAFRHWAGLTGVSYLEKLGVAGRHVLREEPSELALASVVKDANLTLRLSYIDGSHHFDGTLIDFMYLDRLTEPGGIIAIDDAHAPAVRTVASFVAHNLPYKLHYATQRLVLCEKTANYEREWCHYKPFHVSPNVDWDVHDDQPDEKVVPGASFG